ncbi:MAG TPA: hypothetical protein VMJ33_03005 [Gallionella sp.]|nr:hypothetical protein [Gallionella sp.]
MTNKRSDESEDIKQLPSKKDVFSVIPIIWGLVLYLAEIILGYWCVDLLDLLVVVIILGVLIVCLYRGFMYVTQGRYKSAVSLILAIVLLYFPMRHMGDVAYNIRISLNQKQYLEEINSTKPDNKGFRHDKFLWSGRWGEGTELVYDESDELPLLEERQSDDLACPFMVKKN